MGKHKTSKRERKFTAKGSIQARLDKGQTIAPKGKVLRGRKRGPANTAAHDIEAKNKRRKEAAGNKHIEEKEILRQAEDFVGKDNLNQNLGGMDVGSFFAHLEEELQHNIESDSDSDSDNMENDADGSATATSGAAKKSPAKKTRKSAKEESDESKSNSDSDTAFEEDKELAFGKPQQKAIKKTMEDESDNDSVSDSEDDIEAVEARMKAEMKKLESDDPDFHEFLQENEQELLNFGEDDDGDDDDDDDDDDAQDLEDDIISQRKNKNEDDEEEKSSKAGKSIELTPKVLKNLTEGAFTAYGVNSLKKIVRAYKSACQVASSTGESQDDEQSKRNKETTYHIESPQVFDQLMVTCLGKCHEAFYFHLLATDEERESHEVANGSTKTKSGKSTTSAVNSDKDSDDKTKRKNVLAKINDSKKAEEGSSDESEACDSESDEKIKDRSEEDTEDKPLDPNILERSPRWNEAKSILNVFFKSTLHLISESKEPELLSIVLKAMSKYMRYLTPFPRIAESFLKTLTDLWSAPLGDASADYQIVRLNAFLRIRQLALTQPFPFIELCLKKTYLAYARRAKFGGNSASIMTNALPTLTFMGNCLVELYSIDHHSSYQHAFVYIRQLALILRTAIQKKTPEAFQQVYCWQYMHCLKLWVAVLSAACKSFKEGTGGDDQMMRSLVYPLTEIILGTVRVAPAPTRHVPLRFHCVRLLQQLAAASEMYIPTTSLLLDTLDLKELNMKSKKIKAKGGGATTRGIQLPFLLKLGKDDPLRTAEEHEACMVDIMKLLNREADLYRYSAGFPEFSMQIIQRLKKVCLFSPL